MKGKWMVLLVPLLVIAGIWSCADEGDNKPNAAVKIDYNTWTVEQIGGVDFVETSSAIKITFKRPIELTEKGQNLNNIIDVMGAAYRDGMVRKDGDSWLIPIDVDGPGTATVTIAENNREIEVVSKPVVVYMENEFAPITWTVKANGDVENSTNQLIFTFIGDIQEPFFLTSGMIRISPDGSVVDNKQRGNSLVTSALRVPGEGYVFEVTVNTSNTGWVLIQLDMDGVDSFEQRVWVILGTNDIFKPPTGKGTEPVRESVEFSDDQYDFNWEVLKIDLDPSNDFGNGRITGADLKKIRDAWSRDHNYFNSEKASNPDVKSGYGSFLRVYADVSSIIPSETKWAKIAFGNQENTQRQYEGQYHNFAFKSLQGVPVGPGIVTVDGSLRHIIDFLPDSDNYLAINSWDGVIVHAVVLYEIVTPLKIERPARWKKDIAIMCASGKMGGDGAYFHYYDQLDTDNAPEGAWIEFYFKGSGAGTWGSTGWNWTVGRPGCINLTSGDTRNDPVYGRYNLITMTVMNEQRKNGIQDDRNRINPYAGSAFKYVWLCWE